MSSDSQANNSLFDVVVLGEPASKSNSRRLVYNRGKPMFIKSAKALQYLSDFRLQCPKLSPLITGDVLVKIKIFYASKRPDLDESVVLDALQGRVYVNDRQVKEKHIIWGLDTERPRAEISIFAIDKHSRNLR